MENLEVFDKNGKQININDVIFDYLKNNLKINISKDIEKYGYDEKIQQIISVQLLLKDKEISNSKIRLYNFNF